MHLALRAWADEGQRAAITFDAGLRTGAFQRLFAELVNPESTVVETACEAMDDPACRFLVRWP